MTYDRGWYQRHTEEQKARVRTWAKANPEKVAKHRRTNWQKRKETMKPYRKAYVAKNPERWRKYCQAYRGLHRKSYIGQINEYFNGWFSGSQLHHMGQGFGIFIPQSLHKSVQHSLSTGQGMNEVNWAALTWLVGGNTI